MTVINGKTQVYGLIGNPVEHTLSPLIHNTLAEALGHNLAYVPFPVLPDGLGAAVRGAFELNIRGMNVTVPYKNAVIPFLERTDEAAARMGAVNTLVRDQSGYAGYNTDIEGLHRALRSEDIRIAEADILLLGAGGAARAAAFLCADQGAASLIILNRSKENADRLAAEVNASLGRGWAKGMALADYKKLPQKSFLALQSTSVGLYPDSERAVIEDSDFYTKIHTGYDMVYRPFDTKFMKQVRKAGGKAYNGLKMLLYQAVIAYELWNGVTVPEAVFGSIYELMRSMSEPALNHNVILIGFMGSGKTAIGKKLAGQRKAELIDTDSWIERLEGRTITQIFAAEGEDYFRQLETESLKMLLADQQKRIIATGGGLPMNTENRLLLRQLGTVVYLRASSDEVMRRLRGDNTRPLLRDGDTLKTIKQLMELRVPVYEQTADIVIDTDGKDKSTIMEEIVSAIAEREC